MRARIPNQVGLLAILVTLHTSVCLGHGVEESIVIPKESELTVAAPLAGTADFVRILSAQPYSLLDQSEVDALHAISRSIDATQGSSAGNITEQDRLMLKRLASQQLLGILESQDELLELNWREERRDNRISDGVMLSPLRDSLLLKLVDGDGETAFATRPVNLSFSGDPTPIATPVVRGGTTYLLMPLEEIPIGKSGLRLQFEDNATGEPFRWEIINIETQVPGQLSVIVRDEHGMETSVHLRLEMQGTGEFWEPPNSVDLGPIMTRITGLSIYGPGRAVTHYMPGSYRGVYWLVPGDFSTAIPPGDWWVVAHKGYEYAPFRTAVHIEAGKQAEVIVQPERIVDMPSMGWWSGDDHVHSRLLHSEDADNLMAYVEASDIHVANVLEMGDESRTWYSQRGFGREFRVQKGDRVLVPGQEDPRSVFGHVIGMNVREQVRFPQQYLFYDLVADELHKQGALYGHTHVGEGYLGVEKDLALLMPRGKSDFASIMQNVLGTELYYQFLNLGFELTASAGSDVPYGGVVGVTRVFAYLGEGEPFDVDRWYEAFAAGRTFVTNGPMVDLRINGVMPGGRIELDGNPMSVEAIACGIAGESAPVLVELIANGEVVHSITADGQQQEVILSTEVREEHGSWLVLRVRGANGSSAHTSPIYASREGFRHWRFQDVPELIERRRETLTEITGMIDDRERAYHAGEVGATDLWSIVMATTADGLRERVSIASGLYDDLMAQWEKEKQAGRQ